MPHSISPKFGAILIKKDQVDKLKNTSLGSPDFSTVDRSYSYNRHRDNNAQIKGALRYRTGIANLHVGSCWGDEGGAEHPTRNGYEDSILLNTRADAPPNLQHRPQPAPTDEYIKHHPDEEALADALDRVGIQFERGSFKDLYKKAYVTTK